MNRFKNIIKVYKRDIKSLNKNFIAIIIILGFVYYPHFMLGSILKLVGILMKTQVQYL